MTQFKQLLQFVADSFPEITSLLYIINNKCNDTINDLDVHVFKGKDHIFEEMEADNHIPQHTFLCTQIDE